MFLVPFEYTIRGRYRLPTPVGWNLRAKIPGRMTKLLSLPKFKLSPESPKLAQQQPAAEEFRVQMQNVRDELAEVSTSVPQLTELLPFTPKHLFQMSFSDG